ncbi:hypothetical protein D3C71_156500 [compost metagenome]
MNTAPKAKGRINIVAPKPKATVSPAQFAAAFGATSFVASGEKSNPLHAWQAARERLTRIANEAERGKTSNVTGMTDRQYLDHLLSK